MEIKTIPWYVINRGGERIVADSNGIIVTENQEAIEALKTIFSKEEIKPVETLVPKKVIWKSQKKK